MNTPYFLITDYLLTENLEELRKELFDKGVLTKDYPEDGLMLLYHKYDAPITNDLERECRSLVIDRNTRKIVSYSCEMPLLNKEGLTYLLNHQESKKIVNECFEGTYLSVFNHNDKWYVSTRRCLDAHDSLFNQAYSHFDMFEEVLGMSLDEFSVNLNKNLSYYFVLIHHKNKHVIDYTEVFGPEYKKLCLTTVRDSEMRELDLKNFNNLVSNNIFIAPEYDNYEYNEKPNSEGIVVRVYDNERNLYHLVKLQTESYKYNLAIGSDKNIFKGLLYLYQNDKLVEYFENKNVQNMRKIVNPLNTNESYDSIGMVDAIFKVCTSEVFELFKVLWDLKTGKRLDNTLYEMLPKEYKDVLFAVRGIYYKKKAELHKRDDISKEMVKNYHLKISDIYNYFKNLQIDTLVGFLRMRRLMFNWVRYEPKLLDFSSINKYCDRVHLKLCAIFTNKLFPDIMPNDVPV